MTIGWYEKEQSNHCWEQRQTKP